MATHGVTGATGRPARARARPSEHETETRPAFKTTELMAYVVTLAAILIAGAVADDLGARQVWLYATILTVGYMISRGLAKSGSYEKEWDDRRGDRGATP